VNANRHATAARASLAGACPRRVLGYARVSGGEQGRHGTSLEAQEAEIQRYAAARGWPAARLFVEVESASASRIEERVRLAALLAEAEPGDVVLVSKVDRWSRDLAYCVESVRALVARGIGWQSIGEALDAATEQGDSVLGMLSWAANEEHKRIRVRTVGARLALRDQGFYMEGARSFGYQRGERSKRLQRVLFTVESEADLVRQAFERSAGGMSIANIVEWLECETERRWDKKSVWALLRNRLYLGQVKDAAGNWIDTPHVPRIISPELFERATSSRGARRLLRVGRPAEAGARTASWLLRGLAFCAVCGARMSAVYSKRTSNEVIEYFGCSSRLVRKTCDARYVRVSVADAAVNALALEHLQALRSELARPFEEATAPVKRKAPPNLDARIGRNEAARARLVQAFAVGALEEADLRPALDKLAAERARLEALRAEEAPAAPQERATVRPEERATVRPEELADPSRVESAWHALPVAERREALSLLAGRVLLGAEGPRVEWRPLDAVASTPLYRRAA
jgi:DNA invertase Pin-like site-specific DNA recombinase